MSGAMLTREQESDAEVRAVDQQMINTFGRLNARLSEVRGEKDGIVVSGGLAFCVKPL